ncbi:MAG: GDSL-type esterase/lipase family protein, partial [Actinomycetota bacterium]
MPWGNLPPDQVIEQQTTSPDEARARADQGALRVGIVSDSMGFDAGGAMFDAITRTHPVVYNNSIAGGRVDQHLDLALSAVQEPEGPDVLLVILGTAEAQWDPTAAEFEADVRRFLDAVTPHVDCVRWFDTQHRDAHAWWQSFNRNHRQFNAILSSVAAEYDRVEDVHYSTWTELAPLEYFDDDLLHLNWEGRLAMAPLAVQAVVGCEEDTNVAGFWDVKEGHWADDAIAWTAEAGVAYGYPNHTYRAEVGAFALPVTRGQIA